MILFWYFTDDVKHFNFYTFLNIFHLTLIWDFVTLFFWWGDTRRENIRGFLSSYFSLQIFVLGWDCFVWTYVSKGPIALSVDVTWRNVAKLWNDSWQGKAELLGWCRVPVRERGLPLTPHGQRWDLNSACTLISRSITAWAWVLLPDVPFVHFFMMTYFL